MLGPFNKASSQSRAQSQVHISKRHRYDVFHFTVESVDTIMFLTVLLSADCIFSANDIVLPCLIRRRFSTFCNFYRLSFSPRFFVLVSLFFNGDSEDNRIRAHTHRREEGRTSHSLRRPPSPLLLSLLLHSYLVRH